MLLVKMLMDIDPLPMRGSLVMTMAMILPKFLIPAGCQNGVSGVVSWNLVVAAKRNSFWKNVDPPKVFRSESF